MKKSTPIELDLFFQVYRSEIEQKYGPQFLQTVIVSYQLGYSVEGYYWAWIFLPF